MTLNSPFVISARLLPAVRISDGTFISIEIDGDTSDGRTRYRYYIDLPNGTEHESADLKSGCNGGDLQSGMESLLSFLSAAGESYGYQMRKLNAEIDEDSNAAMFPLAISEWAYQHSDELSILEIELQETPNLIS